MWLYVHSKIQLIHGGTWLSPRLSFRRLVRTSSCRPRFEISSLNSSPLSSIYLWIHNFLYEHLRLWNWNRWIYLVSWGSIYLNASDLLCYNAVKFIVTSYGFISHFVTSPTTKSLYMGGIKITYLSCQSISASNLQILMPWNYDAAQNLLPVSMFFDDTWRTHKSFPILVYMIIQTLTFFI